MKKLNVLVLSTLTAAFLVGCGGGSSDSSTGGTTSSTTSVPVTKGPLLQATAEDSSNPAKTGTQIEGTNKYTFTGAITYPITVTDGYVDANNNGIIDAGDYKFTGKLSSYSTVVTPITTYLGDTSKPEGKAKLETLKTLTGANDDDLLKKDPKDVSGEVLSLNAAIYQAYATLMNKIENDDDETEGDDSLSTKYDDYKRAINGTTNLSDALNAVEAKLKTESGVIELDEFDAEKVNFTKKSLIGKKLVVANETYFFRENDIVLGDSGADYTSTANYGTIEDGILRVNFSNGDYDLIELTETGFNISYYENESLVGSPTSVTSELVDYTANELSLVLADVAPVFTNELVSGKVFYPNSAYNSENKLEFYSNGVLKAYHTYNTKNGPVNEPWGNGGDWMITSDGKLRTAFGEGTCYQFEISSAGEGIPVNTTIDFMCDKASEMDEFTATSQYTALSFAGTLTEGNTGTPSKFELTTEMLSGKQIYISDENGTFLGKFYSNGTYSEVWDDTKSGGNSGTCTGTWEVSAFLNITQQCSDSSSSEFVTLVFNEQPAAGVTFSINPFIEPIETSTITTFSDIVDTPTQPTSFVSGKQVVIGDNEGNMTSIFNTDGTYSESGPDSEGGSYSCSGLWRDLGNNKIGVTCQDNGTTEVPDGVVDSNSNEITLQFSSSTLVNQGEVSVTDADGTYPMTIASFTNIKI